MVAYPFGEDRIRLIGQLIRPSPHGGVFLNDAEPGDF